MSDQVDSAPGTAEQAAPQPNSQAPEAQQKSIQTNLPDAVELVRAGLKNPEIREELRRLSQSGEDQLATRIEKRTKEITDKSLGRFAEILGIEPDKAKQAENQLYYEKMVDEYRGGKFRASTPVEEGTLTGSAARQTASSILGGLDIDANSDLGRELLSSVDNKIYSGTDALQKDLMKAVTKKLVQPKASDANRIQGVVGETAPEEPDATALQRRMEEEIIAIRQQNRGRISTNQLTDVKKKYRKLGLDVY